MQSATTERKGPLVKLFRPMSWVRERTTIDNSKEKKWE